MKKSTVGDSVVEIESWSSGGEWRRRGASRAGCPSEGCENRREEGWCVGCGRVGTVAEIEAQGCALKAATSYWREFTDGELQPNSLIYLG